MTRHDDRRDLSPLTGKADEELMLALRMASTPSELDDDVNERLIAAALEDPLAPPTDAELVASARLRAALDGGPSTQDSRLAQAFAAAARPTRLDAHDAQRLVEDALAPRRPRSNVIYVAFGSAVAVTAAAATLLLFLGPGRQHPTPPAAAFVSSRSTTDLFVEKFRTGETSLRIDRIAEARERDLRQNRYLAWGVK